MKHFANFIYSKKLRILRLLMDTKQEDIAYRLNMSQQAYGKLERGKTNFTEQRIKEICTIFKITLNEFTLIESLTSEKKILNEKTTENAEIKSLNNYYEILFIQSELRNIGLEQELKNYKY